jgi:prepilin-type N-terminal cleavage/methylation domain-containing protein
MGYTGFSGDFFLCDAAGGLVWHRGYLNKKPFLDFDARRFYEILLADYILPQMNTRQRPQFAFTLIELLVVIAILAVLLALAVPALQRALGKSDLAGGVSSIKQIGVAMSLYAADNNQRLPGPNLYWGQNPEYNTGDTKLIGTYLYPYLGISQPTWGYRSIKAMAGPAYWRVNKGARPSFPAYIANFGPDILGYLTLPDGTRVYPWGNNTSTIPPANYPALASAGLMRTWALRDIDATGPVKNNQAGWGGSLPKSPIYGKSRLQLNFDMSAEVVSSSLDMTQNR